MEAQQPKPAGDAESGFGPDSPTVREPDERLRARWVGPGTTLGPYTIVRQLGRGGQGSVWVALDGPLKRSVAIKVLNALDGASPATLMRFRREAEVASRLGHPGICTVYAAGVEQGVPYIAMRLLEGTTLSEKVAAARAAANPKENAPLHLSIGDTSLEPGGERDARNEAPSTSNSSGLGATKWVVTILEKAARTLHYAHEQGVVHRDVKPGNIILTEGDEPVILDFGLAWQDDAEQPTLTQSDAVFGTPAYMSPEQIAGARHVDRRTDVWSLAVTGFECLTLQRPFQGPTRAALEQAILNQDPPNAQRLNKSISRDLRVVLETALDKDPNRRYGTALEFADDLRRILDREPILARPPGPFVRLVRWCQRKPALAASVAITALAVVTGLVVSLVLLGEARTALAGEKAAVSDAEAVAGFISEMVAGARPGNYTADATVRDLLDNSAQQVAVRLGNRPAVFARIAGTIARSYVSLGLQDEAVVQFRAAIDAIRRVPGHSASDEANLLASLASAYYRMGDYDKTEAALTETERVLATITDADDAAIDARLWFLDTHSSMHQIRGRLTDAIKDIDEAIAIARRGYGENDLKVAKLLAQQGMNLQAAGRRQSAVELLQRAVTIFESANRDHVDYPSCLANLGYLVLASGKPDDAEPILQRALERTQTVFGRQSARAADVWWRLGMAAISRGRRDEAESRLSEALTLRRQFLGARHVDTATALASLATTKMHKRDFASARTLAEEALAMRRELLGEHAAVASTLQLLARIELQADDLEKAEDLAHQAVEMFTRTLGPGHRDVAIAWSDVAQVQRAQKQYADAEATYRSVIDKLAASAEPAELDIARARWDLGTTLLLQSKFEEAERTVRQAYEIFRRMSPPTSAVLTGVTEELARTLEGLGRDDEAVRLHLDSIDGCFAADPPRPDEAGASYATLGQNLTRRKKWDDAETHLKDGIARMRACKVATSEQVRAALRRLIDLYTAANRPADARRVEAELPPPGSAK